MKEKLFDFSFKVEKAYEGNFKASLRFFNMTEKYTEILRNKAYQKIKFLGWTIIINSVISPEIRINDNPLSEDYKLVSIYLPPYYIDKNKISPKVDTRLNTVEFIFSDEEEVVKVMTKVIEILNFMQYYETTELINISTAEYIETVIEDNLITEKENNWIKRILKKLEKK